MNRGRAGLALAGQGAVAFVRAWSRCRLLSPVESGPDRRQARSSWASSPREVIPALAKMLRRWKATVLGEIQHCAATSLLDRPELTSRAICSSVGVSLTSVD